MPGSRRLIALLLLALGCARPSRTPPTIGSVDALRAAFERDAGKPRLVLLLSPT